MITCAKPVLRDNQKMGNQILEARRTPIIHRNKATATVIPFHFEEQRLVFSQQFSLWPCNPRRVRTPGLQLPQNRPLVGRAPSPGVPISSIMGIAESGGGVAPKNKSEAGANQPRSITQFLPEPQWVRAGRTPDLRCERVNSPSRHPYRRRDRPASRVSCPSPESQ